MQLSTPRRWKIVGLVLAALLLAPLVVSMKGVSQPPSTSTQPAPTINPQDETDQSSSASVNGTNGLEQAADSENEEFALALDMQPMMGGPSAEQLKLIQQNRLLLLIDRAQLSKDQLTLFKSVTEGLIKAREEERTSLANQQKQLNDFLLKFQGTEEELTKGLQPLRQAEQAIIKTFLEKVAAGEKSVAQSLSLEQGEKFLQGAHQRMAMHRGRMGDNRGPMHQQRGPQGMNPVQPSGEQLPKVGPLGQFLLRNLDTLDAALGAKLAAIGK